MRSISEPPISLGAQGIVLNGLMNIFNELKEVWGKLTAAEREALGTYLGEIGAELGMSYGMQIAMGTMSTADALAAIQIRCKNNAFVGEIIARLKRLGFE